MVAGGAGTVTEVEAGVVWRPTRGAVPPPVTATTTLTPVATTPTPNDQRSDTKNSNNPAHKQAQDNRADQLNPNNEDTKK